MSHFDHCFFFSMWNLLKAKHDLPQSSLKQDSDPRQWNCSPHAPQYESAENLHVAAKEDLHDLQNSGCSKPTWRGSVGWEVGLQMTTARSRSQSVYSCSIKQDAHIPACTHKPSTLSQSEMIEYSWFMISPSPTTSLAYLLFFSVFLCSLI